MGYYFAYKKFVVIESFGIKIN